MMKHQTFGTEKGGVIFVDPVGTAKGFTNTDLVRLEITSRRHRVLYAENMTAGMARCIGNALLEAAAEVEA